MEPVRNHVAGSRFEKVKALSLVVLILVWAVDQDDRRMWKSERYVALKVGVRNSSFGEEEAGRERAEHELKLSTHIAETNPSHEGHSQIRKLFEVFTLRNGDEEHSCFVYEFLREPMNVFQASTLRTLRSEGGKIPVILFKFYMKTLLEALDYLHSECHIIHTGMFSHNHLKSLV